MPLRRKKVQLKKAQIRKIKPKTISGFKLHGRPWKDPRKKK